MAMKFSVLELDPKASLWVETTCPSCKKKLETYADFSDCRQTVVGETRTEIHLTCDCSHEWRVGVKVTLSLTPDDVANVGQT
jgi:hypothetical protein